MHEVECQVFKLDKFGGDGKYAPDEFAVVDRAPLVLPPESELRPPRPGEPRAQEIDPGRQAYEALFPDAVKPEEEKSGGELAILRQQVERHAKAGGRAAFVQVIDDRVVVGCQPLERTTRGRYERAVQRARERIQDDGRVEDSGSFSGLPLELSARVQPQLRLSPAPTRPARVKSAATP